MSTSPVSQSGVYTGLLDELPVAKDATTSRTVVKNDVLSQVLFSFDAGQALTEHASPKAVIVQILNGKMNFTVGGKTTLLQTGDVIYLAPNDPHALEAVEPCHMALTMVNVNTND
ncbi:cupin domain-containing protein [Stomatohabitans albus]|uniref:cupin domain-containing protein n=1 Tax=Stomatohabitans albus TaxID=3110766 RepID=UPI00300D8DE1